MEEANLRVAELEESNSRLSVKASSHEAVLSVLENELHRVSHALNAEAKTVLDSGKALSFDLYEGSFQMSKQALNLEQYNRLHGINLPEPREQVACEGQEEKESE